MGDLVPILICGMLFIGVPWLILHYVTKWKQAAPNMTGEDENLLDDMYLTARRLEERLETVERIIAADHPDFRANPSAPAVPERDYSRRN
jgi:phage shock protein B